MNVGFNDFILAVKNYDSIMVSMPVPDTEVTKDSLPTLYKLFLTISTLLKDDDPDLFSFINEKWESVGEDEQLRLVKLVNEGNKGVFFNEDDEFDTGKDDLFYEDLQKV